MLEDEGGSGDRQLGILVREFLVGYINDLHY